MLTTVEFIIYLILVVLFYSNLRFQLFRMSFTKKNIYTGCAKKKKDILNIYICKVANNQYIFCEN